MGVEEAQRTTIAGKDIGRKIFSEATDKIILENLINNGIKDETGSLVGKSIIFALHQDHAWKTFFAKSIPIRVMFMWLLFSESTVFNPLQFGTLMPLTYKLLLSTAT